MNLSNVILNVTYETRACDTRPCETGQTCRYYIVHNIIYKILLTSYLIGTSFAISKLTTHYKIQIYNILRNQLNR